MYTCLIRSAAPVDDIILLLSYRLMSFPRTETAKKNTTIGPLSSRPRYFLVHLPPSMTTRSSRHCARALTSSWATVSHYARCFLFHCYVGFVINVRLICSHSNLRLATMVSQVSQLSLLLVTRTVSLRVWNKSLPTSGSTTRPSMPTEMHLLPFLFVCFCSDLCATSIHLATLLTIPSQTLNAPNLSLLGISRTKLTMLSFVQSFSSLQ